MIKRLVCHNWLIFIIISILSSCYKEEVKIPNPEKEAFNFVMTPKQKYMVNAGRGVEFEVVDPLPSLIFYNNEYALTKFEIRGAGSLNYRRKGFSVKLDKKMAFYLPEEHIERDIKEFKLIAMVFDYTYINNNTAFMLFKEIGLWPCYNFFTEVLLNNNTQGIYMFIEDPAEYFLNNRNSSMVIKRGYYHTIKNFNLNNSLPPESASDYFNRFQKIYTDILAYSGQQLFDSLSSKLDLEEYFSRMAINYLIKNGDYTDEVLFYSKWSGGKEIFGVIPWDNDDLFMAEPHEIGRAWAVGSVFGVRVYNSMKDIIADIGDKLIFSIEDDLDYKIAKDAFLYAQYLKTLERVITKIDDNAIDKIFEYNESHLMPFYANDSIIAQSKYDVKATNLQLFNSNLIDKRKFLKDRRALMLQKLNNN
jgi:spore coat protein H